MIRTVHDHNVCPKHSSAKTTWQACFMLHAYRAIAMKCVSGSGLKEAVRR